MTSCISLNYLLQKIIFNSFNSFGLKYAVAPSQIAFGQGGASTFIKSYGIPKGGSSSSRGQGSAVNGMLSLNAQSILLAGNETLQAITLLLTILQVVPMPQAPGWGKNTRNHG